MKLSKPIFATLIILSLVLGYCTVSAIANGETVIEPEFWDEKVNLTYSELFEALSSATLLSQSYSERLVFFYELKDGDSRIRKKACEDVQENTLPGIVDKIKNTFQIIQNEDQRRVITMVLFHTEKYFHGMLSEMNMSCEFSPLDVYTSETTETEEPSNE